MRVSKTPSPHAPDFRPSCPPKLWTQVGSGRRLHTAFGSRSPNIEYMAKSNHTHLNDELLNYERDP